MYKDYAIDYNTPDRLRQARSLLRQTRNWMDVSLYAVLLSTLIMAYLTGIPDIKRLWLLFIPAFVCHMLTIGFTRLAYEKPSNVDEHVPVELLKADKIARKIRYKNKLRAMMDTSEILGYAIYAGCISIFFCSIVTLMQFVVMVRMLIMG